MIGSRALPAGHVPFYRGSAPSPAETDYRADRQENETGLKK